MIYVLVNEDNEVITSFDGELQEQHVMVKDGYKLYELVDEPIFKVDFGKVSYIPSIEDRLRLIKQ